MNNILDLLKINFAYETTRRVLNNVSFSLRKGERLLIIGHNGSGKSTLVKILGKLLEPENGNYFFNDKDIHEYDIREIRRKIGIVFQNPESQLVASIVEDDVAFALENQGVKPSEIQTQVDWALEQVGMLHKKKMPVNSLSGGEKQRIAIAGALVSKNLEVLILDEPLAMLDQDGRYEIEKILRELHGNGITIIEVTHILENHLRDINRVMVLKEGKIACETTAHEFLDKAKDYGFNLDANFWKFNKNSETSNKILYSIRKLSFKFENSDYVFRNFDYDIKEGLWLSIIGRTGAGKSTLIQHLNGLYKVQEGEILYKGKPFPEDLTELRKEVGLVFQSPEDQIFSQSVYEEIAFAPKNAGYSPDEVNERVLKALSRVGLSTDFLERNPINLSGGEKRLVAIASVISMEPECLILDEPLSGLDEYYRVLILDLLTKMRAENRTIITVTHDLGIAFEYADEILQL